MRLFVANILFIVLALATALKAEIIHDAQRGLGGSIQAGIPYFVEISCPIKRSKRVFFAQNIRTSGAFDGARVRQFLQTISFGNMSKNATIVASPDLQLSVVEQKISLEINQSGLNVLPIPLVLFNNRSRNNSNFRYYDALCDRSFYFTSSTSNPFALSHVYASSENDSGLTETAIKAVATVADIGLQAIAGVALPGFANSTRTDRFANAIGEIRNSFIGTDADYELLQLMVGVNTITTDAMTIQISISGPDASGPVDNSFLTGPVPFSRNWGLMFSIETVNSLRSSLPSAFENPDSKTCSGIFKGLSSSGLNELDLAYALLSLANQTNTSFADILACGGQSTICTIQENSRILTNLLRTRGNLHSTSLISNLTSAESSMLASQCTIWKERESAPTPLELLTMFRNDDEEQNSDAAIEETRSRQIENFQNAASDLNRTTLIRSIINLALHFDSRRAPSIRELIQKILGKTVNINISGEFLLEIENQYKSNEIEIAAAELALGSLNQETQSSAEQPRIFAQQIAKQEAEISSLKYRNLFLYQFQENSLPVNEQGFFSTQLNSDEFLSVLIAMGYQRFGCSIRYQSSYSDTSAQNTGVVMALNLDSQEISDWVPVSIIAFQQGRGSPLNAERAIALQISGLPVSAESPNLSLTIRGMNGDLLARNTIAASILGNPNGACAENSATEKE